MATTGNYWNVKNPNKPVGEIDPQDVLDIPVSWEDFLTEIGATLATPGAAGHQLYAVAPLEVVSSAQSLDNLGYTFRLRVDPLLYDEDLHFKRTFPVVQHIVASDGQEKDQTLWFKITDH